MSIIFRLKIYKRWFMSLTCKPANKLRDGASITSRNKKKNQVKVARTSKQWCQIEGQIPQRDFFSHALNIYGIPPLLCSLASQLQSHVDCVVWLSWSCLLRAPCGGTVIKQYYLAVIKYLRESIRWKKPDLWRTVDHPDLKTRRAPGNR